jgi:hypothetical protein
MTVAERLKSFFKNAQDDSGRTPKINLKNAQDDSGRMPEINLQKRTR